MKKEILILISIFLILSFIMHYEQWLSTPIEHMLNLEKSGAYGFGFSHPFIFVLFIYIILLLPRLLIKFFKKNIIK